MGLAVLLLEVAASVVVGRVVEDQLQVGAGSGEGDLGVALAAPAGEPHLALFWRPVAVARVSYLALSAQPFKEIIGFEFRLLIGNHSRHLEDKSGFRLFVQSNRVKG